MTKFTAKFVRDELSDMFIDLTPEELSVHKVQKSKSTGKKVKVVDKEATIANIERWLLYYNGVFDALAVFEQKFPDGIDEVVNAYKADWEALREFYEESWSDEYEAFAEAYYVSSYYNTDDDEDEEDEDDDTPDYSDMSLGELRKECKARALKYSPKHKEADLIAMLEELDAQGEEDEEDSDDESDEDEAEEETSEYADMSLSELRKKCKSRGIKFTPKHKADDLIAMLEESDSDEEDDDEDEEDEDDDTPDYSDMSLGELRKECKSRGLKWSPKHKADDLIAMLEENDNEVADDNEDEDDEEPDESADDDSDDEEVSEESLDEILDEAFEDETFEEEETKAPEKGRRLPPKPKKK